METKNISLLTTAVLVITFFVFDESSRAPLRMLAHANIAHCLLNCYALLAVCFLMRVTVRDYLIALAVGVCALYLPWQSYILGVSGMVYALYAIMSWRVPHRRKFHTYMLATILIGVLIPHVAYLYHLVCYVAGVIVGYPLSIYAKRKS